MLRYERAVESKRRPGQRRIEVFSPKIKRRLTLFSWDSQDAWLLLEADPPVRAFCQRPAYVDGESKRGGCLISGWTRAPIPDSGRCPQVIRNRSHCREPRMARVFEFCGARTRSPSRCVSKIGRKSCRTESAFCGIRSPVSRESDEYCSGSD